MRGAASRSRSDPRVAPVAGPEPTGESAQRRRVIGSGKSFAIVAPGMEVKLDDTSTRMGYPRGLPLPDGAPPRAKVKGSPPNPPYPKVPPELPPPAKSSYG